MPRLTDPWFECEFYSNATANSHRLQGQTIEGSQGIFLSCPCCYGTTEPVGDKRPHHLMIPFANPRNAPQLPDDHGPTSRDGKTHPRWMMIGNGLHDLTLTPSVDVGKDSCWHGHITNGEVT